MRRFSRVGGAYAHLDKNLPILHDRPMVHTRGRGPVTQVVEWNNLTTGILGSNPTGVHSLVRLPKACWWDLMKVETAVQVMAGQVWSFLMHGSRSQKVPPTDTTLICSMLGPVKSTGVVTQACRPSGYKPHQPSRTSPSFTFYFASEVLAWHVSFKFHK